MYFLLGFLFVAISQFSQFSDGCTCTCATCPTLPMTDPPVSPGTARGPGTVTMENHPSGCKQYTVHCDAVGTNFVVIGANQQFIQLSEASPGEKTAILLCNDLGQIEGCDTSDNTHIVQSVYCSYAT